MKKRIPTNNLKLVIIGVVISILQLNCQKDDFDIDNNSLKTSTFPYQIKSRTLSQLQSNSTFNFAIKEAVNKGKSNMSAKTVMEDQYGFTIDSTLIKEIVSEDYTSYTFFIHRTEDHDTYYENLVVEIDSTNIPEAYIIKYTPNSESVYLYEEDSYTFDSEIEIAPITYNVNESKVTNGECVGILMCPWGGSDHPAGQACIDANRTGEDALYLDDSMCDESSGGGGDGGSSSSGNGSPGGDGTSGTSGSSGGGGGGSSGSNSDPNTDTTACKACGDTNEVITSPIIKDELVDDDCNTSKEDLKKIFPNASDSDMSTLAYVINNKGKDFGIDTKEKLQHFLAQAGHEVGGFNNGIGIEESLYYTTASRLKTVYEKYFQQNAADTTGTKREADSTYLRNSSKVANYVYCCRMGNGNEASGDGYKYRGRGIFQLTGKANYTSFKKWYNKKYDPDKDFVSNPEMLKDNDTIAILSALWYYKTKVLDNITVDSTTTVKVVTKRVNGGRNGLTDRKETHTKAKDSITCL